jgi:iron complex transport system substrate-binding protein
VRLSFHRLALAGLLVGGAAAVWAGMPHQRSASATPQRIVSLNLCADQLVLALADRAQIAGLTRNAAEPQMSAAAAQARGLRILRSSTEEILAINPDLLVGVQVGQSGTLAGYVDRGYTLLDLENAESLAQIETTIRQSAAAFGHRERGEALIARMRRDLAGIPANGGGKVAAYYQRRGYLTGTGTLIDELMRRAGLINLATKLGKPPLSQVSLEEIVAARPDFLIVESATDRVTDQGTEMLHHPALARIPRISMPQAWTVCGGPAYVTAARSIAEQIARPQRHR